MVEGRDRKGHHGGKGTGPKEEGSTVRSEAEWSRRGEGWEVSEKTLSHVFILEMAIWPRPRNIN